MEKHWINLLREPWSKCEMNKIKGRQTEGGGVTNSGAHTESMEDWRQ